MRRPSAVTRVSFANALRCVRVRARAVASSVRRPASLSIDEAISSRRWSASSWAYQTSRVRLPANSLIRSRYALTHARTVLFCSLTEKPFARAAVTKPAARRLTSHSNGPGRVSSKSLMSKTRRRSGEASSLKFSGWASPQSCTCSPVFGRGARSAAMIAAAPR